jgi:hypothetical protein
MYQVEQDDPDVIHSGNLLSAKVSTLGKNSTPGCSVGECKRQHGFFPRELRERMTDNQAHLSAGLELDRVRIY